MVFVFRLGHFFFGLAFGKFVEEVACLCGTVGHNSVSGFGNGFAFSVFGHGRLFCLGFTQRVLGFAGLGNLVVGLDEELLHLRKVVGLPELELCGSLEEFAHTLRVFDTGQFDEDTARVLHLLDVGLGHAETVDTGAENLVGTVDGTVAFALQNLQHVAVGRVDGDAFVLEFIQENGSKTGVGVHFFVGLTEQGDEVALALLVANSIACKKVGS